MGLRGRRWSFQLTCLTACSGLIAILGCQTIPPPSYLDLAALLPADTSLYLQLNLRPEHRDFFYRSAFRPILGEEGWVRDLLHSSNIAVVGSNAQQQISVLLQNNYSRLVLAAGLKSLPEWQQQQQTPVYLNVRGILDLSRTDLLFFSQQPSASLAQRLALPSSSPWPQELQQQLLQDPIVFYSPNPSQLPFLEKLPLARDTLQQLWGWVQQQEKKTLLVLQLSTPSAARTQALLLSLRLVLPPLLFTSGVPSLQQQARKLQLEAQDKQLTLRLPLEADGLAALIALLVPKFEL